VVVSSKLSSNAAGNGSVGNTGFWSVPDEIERVCAPPVLFTTPVRRSRVADESADNELWVSVDGADGPLWSVDEEPEEPGDPEDEELDDEPDSDGSAIATPGMVATAEPTPSATASAPTRPT
jgi:hypothetical protein